jgi:protein-disulfide isomerase
MRLRTTVLLVPLSALFLLPASLFAQASDPEVEELKKQMEELKKGQAAIQKDLADIKKLIQQRPAPRQAPQVPKEATLDLTGKPFKGAADAKLVLVEFSDYQ